MAVDDPIVLIGEYTLPVGFNPQCYNLVTVQRSGEITYYNLDEVVNSLASIENTLGEPISLKLVNSIELKSRVIYPAELMDRPLLRFDKPKFSIKRIIKLIFQLGIEEIETSFTGEVEKYLQRHAVT